MAKISTYDGFQAQERAGGGAFAPFSTSVPQIPDMGLDRQVARVSKAADAAFERFLKEQDDARVTEAMNSLRRRAIELESGENGFKSLLGRNALDPDDQGRSLIERMDTAIQEYGQSLSENMTRRQRDLFAEKAGTVYQAVYGGVTQHVFEQSRQYSVGQANAAIAVAQEEGAAYAFDPVRLDASASDIRQRVATLAQLQGLDGNACAVMERKALSGMYGNAIAATLDPANPRAAEQGLAILDRYGRFMEAGDAVRARAQVNAALEGVRMRDAVDAFVSTQAVGDEVVPLRVGEQTAPGVSVNANILRGMEAIKTAVAGGLQTYADTSGGPEASRYGVSSLTLKEGMAAAKLAGREWNEELFRTDRAYNEVLGTAYLNSMMERFGGDKDRAYAAYFSSPEQVEAAWEDANKTGKSFFDNLPEGVWKKVQRVMDRERETSTLHDEEGNTINAFSPEGVAMGPRWQTAEEARNYFKATYAWADANPMRLDTMVQLHTARINEKKAAYKEYREKFMSNALKELYAVNGDFSKVSPATIARLTAAEQAEFQKIGERIYKAVDVTDPMAAAKLSDDRYLVNLSPAALDLYRPLLSKRDWSVVEGRYWDLREKMGESADARIMRAQKAQKGEVDPGFSVSSDRIRRALTAVVPGWDEYMKDKPQEAGVYVFNMQTRLALEGMRTGQKLDSDEAVFSTIREYSRDIVNVNVFGGSNTPIWSLRYEDMPDTLASDIKPMLRKMAKDKLARRGLDRDPADAELTEALQDVLFG